MQQFENKHLDMRSQFFMRIGSKLLRNPDAAYRFIGIVCGETSISELAMIEALFNNSLQNNINTNEN
ncbi:hypothetical protein IJ541_10815 [bacterium]|nr:hypothetical protein [bacterium]